MNTSHSVKCAFFFIALLSVQSLMAQVNVSTVPIDESIRYDEQTKMLYFTATSSHPNPLKRHQDAFADAFFQYVSSLDGRVLEYENAGDGVRRSREEGSGICYLQVSGYVDDNGLETVVISNDPQKRQKFEYAFKYEATLTASSSSRIFVIELKDGKCVVFHHVIKENDGRVKQAYTFMINGDNDTD